MPPRLLRRLIGMPSQVGFYLGRRTKAIDARIEALAGVEFQGGRDRVWGYATDQADRSGAFSGLMKLAGELGLNLGKGLALGGPPAG